MTTTADTKTLDEEIEAFAEQLFGATLGYAELTVAAFGRALGLYATLRGSDGSPPPTSPPASDSMPATYASGSSTRPSPGS